MTTTRAGKARAAAEKAAGLERSGRWAQATSMWRSAKSLFAKSPTGHANIKYCSNRADRCEAMAIEHDDDY